MRYFKIYLVLAVVSLLSFTSAHKFYISVSNIEYSEKDKSLQIISRIFIDDFEDLLEERYNIKPQLATKNELENVNTYIANYISGQLTIKVNGEAKKINFIGKKYEDDVMKCYLEIPNISKANLRSIEVSNKVLFDMFKEQQNIIHIKINDERKSFICVKENHKGMLNF